MSSGMTQNTTDEESVPLLNGTENNQAGDNQQLQVVNTVKTFTFTSSGEFFLLRFLLRILSLWSPRSSGCFGRYLYPALINLLLALVVLLYIAVPNLSKIFRVTLVIMSAGGYLSHLTGLFYFRSGDLEDNMAFITLDGPRFKRFRRGLIHYNCRIVISTIVLSVFYFFVLSDIYHDLKTFLAVLCYFSHAYMLGMYLAVLWIIDLLELTSRARLEDQHHKFIKWTTGAEEAINCHICCYTLTVENTCRRLQWWFLIHNISLAIIIPYLATNSQLVPPYEVGKFIVVIGSLMLIWVLPLYFAEQIGRNDVRFRSKVNNFCPEQLLFTINSDSRETAVNLDGNHHEENVEDLTFISRTEVQLLVTYLKNIRSGFLSVGYSFQLKLSLIATVLSLAALIFKTIKV